MAWIYFLALEEFPSHSGNGLDQSPIAKSTPTVKESCSVVWEQKNYDTLQFGMTSELYLNTIYQGALILSMEDFHARTLALQDMEKDWVESEMDYGNPFEMDRAKCLGNSVCPQQTREAFKILMGIK